MVYDPTKDFLGLWRNVAGNVSKLEMPGLDYVVSALARAGVVTVSVSATAPVANQATTAWLKAAVPSYSAEGALFLWDKLTTTYLAATPTLFLQFLEACANESGISWWTTTGGAPANVIGNNGDYAMRTDTPGGIYGPKAAGAWPATPLPGTTDTITSTALDNTFGTTEGLIIYRGPAVWQALPIGADHTLLMALGNVPTWEVLSSLMDLLFGSSQGSIMYRDVAAWKALAPGVTNNVLTTQGAGANPNWTPKSSEFQSGTSIVFNMSAAPTGWTKQTALNDYGLRVTNGSVGVVAGTPFSTVFAQTVVGNTTISAAQMPSHTHSTDARKTSGAQAVNAVGSVLSCDAAASNGSAGSDQSHAHSINLTLSYIDVIIATKN